MKSARSDTGNFEGVIRSLLQRVNFNRAAEVFPLNFVPLYPHAACFVLFRRVSRHPRGSGKHAGRYALEKVA